MNKNKMTENKEARLQDPKPQKLSGIKPGASTEELMATLIGKTTEEYMPWETSYLPSSGIFYNWPDGKFEIRPMDQTAEKIMTTDRLIRSGEALTKIIERYVRFPNNPTFTQNDLLAGDRAFILYYLRGITYGNQYEFSIECPECEMKEIKTINLSEYAEAIKPVNPKYTKEPIEVILPYLSSVLGRETKAGIRLMRQADIDIAIKNAKLTKQKIDGSILADYTKNLIVNIMGSTDIAHLAWVRENLHATDVAEIRNVLSEAAPGMEGTIKLKCSCGKESETILPFSDQFFPKSKR